MVRLVVVPSPSSAVAVVAPAPQGAVAADPTGVRSRRRRPTSRWPCPPGPGGPVDGGAVTDLADWGCGPSTTTCRRRGSRTCGAPALDRLPGGGADLHRRGPVGGGPVTDLAVGVVAPAPQRVVAADPTGLQPPGVTDFQVAAPICTGTVRSLRVPSPTSPFGLKPQHHSVSLLRIPHECLGPTATVFQVAVPTWTGSSGRRRSRRRPDPCCWRPSTTACRCCESHRCGRSRC